jgi:uncharacterized protein (DUF488 family)
MTIWTIGSSTRSLDEFIALLKSYGIAQVVDVRHYPASRLEHFRRANLEVSLPQVGSSYLWLGESLGGYRKGGYEAYMETDSFRQGIEQLTDFARQKPTAIMCAEVLSWKCHRRFIGAALTQLDWTVIHIIDEKHTWDGVFNKPPKSKKQGTLKLPGQ